MGARSLLACIPGLLSAACLAQVPDGEPEWFFYSLRLEDRVLRDALPTLAGREAPRLPLQEFCQALGLGIRVDAPRGQATGFFLNEKRRFRLDLSRSLAVVEGRELPFPKEAVLARQEDLYVDLRLLQQWFPLAVEADLHAATLKVKPRELLPLQAQWERERRLALQKGKDSEAPPTQPAPDPYRPLEIPMVDQTLGLTYQAKGSDRFETRGSTFLAGDLLWMSGSAYLNLTPQGHVDLERITLRREDPAAHLLGPLRAREVALGDLDVPAMDFSTAPRGRGAMVSSFPLDFRSSFDTRSFRGVLLPGWSVELYQNGALVGSQASRADGQYAFLELPLRFGLNDFRLVFHGPYGQRREESIRLDLSDAQPRAGEFYYRVLGLDPKARQRRTGDQDVEPEPGPLWRAESVYGLAKWMSVNGGLLFQDRGSGSRGFALAGTRLVLPFLSARASAMRDRSGREQAALVDLRTGYGYHSLSLRRENYRNWQVGTGGQNAEEALSSRTTASLQGTWRKRGMAFQAGILAQEDRLAEGGFHRRASLTLAGSTGLWYAGNTANWSRHQGVQTTQPTFDGNLYVSREGERLSVRSEVAYQRLAGAMRLQRGMGTLEYRPRDDTNWQLRLTRFVQQGQTQIQLAFNKLRGRVGLGALASYSRENGFSCTLTLQTSLAREPRTGRFAMDALPQASQGAVSALAYLDANGNGRRDAGEQAVEEVRYRVNGSPGSSRITHPEVAFLGQAGRSTPCTFAIATESLENPFLGPGGPPYSFLPRPGHVLRLDLPLVASGELSGTIHLNGPRGRKPLPGVEVELVEAGGRVRFRQRSAYDGFFDFLGIPAGAYLLRVAPDSLSPVGLRASPPRFVVVTPSGTPVDGLDFTLEAAAPSPHGGAR